MIKKIIRLCIYNLGFFWSRCYSYSDSRKWDSIINYLYTAWISCEFRSIGKSSIIQCPIILLGGRYISIGEKTSIGKRTVLTAWDKHQIDRFFPEVIIGDNCSLGDDNHITAINRIEIGNNVLTGKKITITDNAHGKSEVEFLSMAPQQRPLYSKGSVIIEDGVWIGDKVTILPGVRIGKNAIIGANAVVDKDVPANCVVGGIPSKVIKVMTI